MNIEISEVFVLHTDSISTEPVVTRVGIAGILPNRPRVIPNVKHFRVPSFTEVLESIFERLAKLLEVLAPKQTRPPFLPDPMFHKVQKLDRFLTIS
jgi:hypothetical protein